MLRYWFAFSFVITLDGLSAQTSVAILFTNNTNGIAEICDCGVDPLGGLSRRKTLFDSLQKVEPQLVKLDAGDFLDAFGFNPKKDELVIALYKELGYDAINVGDQEFANGSEFIRQHLLQAGLPLVSSTLAVSPGTMFVFGNVVIQRQNVRIGVIGYLPWSSFMYFPDKSKLTIQPFGDGVEILRNSVEALRPNVDLLVVLSQAGFEGDREWIKHISGIDLVIGGHSQTELLEPHRQGETLIVQAGGGTHVGRIVLERNKTKWTVREHRLIPLNSEIREEFIFRDKIKHFEGQRSKN